MCLKGDGEVVVFLTTLCDGLDFEPILLRYALFGLVFTICEHDVERGLGSLLHGWSGRFQLVSVTGLGRGSSVRPRWSARFSIDRRRGWDIS